MYVKELWRYPVKSLGGERLKEAQITEGGLEGDRAIFVERRGRVVTSRTDHRLLGLKGSLGADGVPRIDGVAWNLPEALALVREAAGPDASLARSDDGGVFDILPLLVATDGAIAHMNIDSRRLRPNIVVGGVDGLAERGWPGRSLRIGEVRIGVAQLRGRCVMTTYDPDTLKQDLTVLKSIVGELDGTMALDCSVLAGGLIHEGDAVELLG